MNLLPTGWKQNSAFTVYPLYLVKYIEKSLYLPLIYHIGITYTGITSPHMIRSLITACLISFIFAGQVTAQAKANQEEKLKAINNYVQFTNESTHGLLIVHRLLENFNKNINKYVDLPDQQINFYSNKDLPQDIFEDSENWFYDTSPNEWNVICKAETHYRCCQSVAFYS